MQKFPSPLPSSKNPDILTMPENLGMHFRNVMK